MEATNKDSATKLHIVMFPWFAFGHINPFLHLSNKLNSYGIQITFLSIPGNIPYILKSPLFKSPTNNQVIPLTIPPTAGLSPDFDSTCDLTPETNDPLGFAVEQMQPQVKSLLSKLQPHVVILDFCHHWVPQLASQVGAKAVNFFIFPAASSAYYIGHSFMMNETGKTPSVEELKNPPTGFPSTSITSIKTFHARKFAGFYLRSHDKPSFIEQVIHFMNSCDAIICRMCPKTEGQFIDYLQTLIQKPFLPIGPIVPPPLSDGLLDQNSTNWLDKFSDNSVVYCNFGSESYLNDDQIKELVLGLELTGLPFYLVLKFGTGVIEESQAKLEAALPEGFRERMKDRALVCTGWVDQRRILAHKSVGCFISHVGYSSMIEAIVSDVQIVGLPINPCQCFSAKVVSEEMKIGVEVPRRDEDGWFGREDVVAAVRRVMVENDDDEWRSIRENRTKWREFLLNEDVEEGYIATLVKELQDLAQTFEVIQ